MKPVIIIPAYQPGEKLIQLLNILAMDPQQRVIIVDDGSTGKSRDLLTSLSKRFNAVEILRHGVNLGKGQALKTGFIFFLRNYTNQNCPGVVTVDADGQHIAEDISLISKALEMRPKSLCLGSRTFDRTVPFLSLLGNKLTAFIFNFFTCVSLIDTQTGLRGIPADFLGELLHFPESGYDFELKMLITAVKSSRDIFEIPIQTIYLDNNKSSHFSCFRDSFKIYSVFARTLLQRQLPKVPFLNI